MATIPPKYVCAQSMGNISVLKIMYLYSLMEGNTHLSYFENILDMKNFYMGNIFHKNVHLKSHTQILVPTQANPEL